MYSTEQRKIAIDLLIQYDFQYTKVVAQLGYPSVRELRRWYERYTENHTYSRKFVGRKVYSDEQKQKAIDYFMEHGRNISRTCRKLGYPKQALLAKWVYTAHPELKTSCSKSTSLIHLEQDQKETAVLDLCSRVGTAQVIADKYGVRRETLYLWKKNSFQRGAHQKCKKQRKILTQKQRQKELKNLLAR